MSKNCDIFIVCMLSVFCAMFGLSLLDYPANGIGAAYIYGNDFAEMQQFLESGRMFWKSDGHLAGYNPFFMAGYPFADYTSGHLWKLLGILFPSLNAGTIATLFLMGSLCIYPLAGYFALRIFGRDKTESTLGAIFSAFLALLGPPLFFAWMGLEEAVAAAVFFLLAAAFLFKWIRSGGFIFWLGLVLSASLAVMAHKTATVALLFAGSGALIFLRTFSKRIALGALAGAISVVANLFWILPLWRYREYFDFMPHNFWGEKNGPAAIFELFKPFGLLGSLPLIWIFLLGTFFGWRLLRRVEKSLADAWFFTQVIILIFAYFGPFINFLNPVQPRRFAVYFLALAVFPTAIVCNKILSSIKLWHRPLVIVSLAAALFILPNSYNRWSPFKLMTTFPPRAQAVVAWISQNTTRDARVMVEEINDAGRADNPYGGSYLNALLPSLTNREIIGGPFPGIDIIHHRVTLMDDKLMGRPVSEMTDNELARILELYNIGWIVSFSAGSKSRFALAANFIEKTAEFGPIQCFSVKGEKSFLIGGRGEVQAGPNTLKVKIARLDGRSVVLKYHWLPSFRVNPAYGIEKFDVDIDPVGFIKVYMEEPGEFVIRNGR